MEGPQAECCHHLPQCSPQRGFPTPKLGNILHSADQFESSPAPFQAELRTEPRLGPFPLGPTRGVSPSLQEHNTSDRQESTAGGFIQHF